MVTGRVTEVWRYPVKSMLGERLDASEVNERGLVGDRSFALIDTATGKLCSAKRHDLWGRLFEFRASLIEPGRVKIVFPDGSEHATDERGISGAISELLGRDVKLCSTAPQNLQIEEIWDEAKGDQKYGATVDHAEGEDVIQYTAAMAVPGGGFFDAAAVHLLTTSTVAEFAKREPGSAFDVRRYRPNVVVEAEGDGFVENDWKIVRIGDVELRTLMPVPRCVMTTLPQDELPRDPNVLRSAARHNMVDTKVLGDMPCAGLYMMVANSGTLRVGESVTVT